MPKVSIHEELFKSRTAVVEHKNTIARAKQELEAAQQEYKNTTDGARKEFLKNKIAGLRNFIEDKAAELAKEQRIFTAVKKQKEQSIAEFAQNIY